MQGNQRRCLTNRAAAAAAAGHSGAQIAILKQAAVGARISVWWPLDEHWYRCALPWGRGGVLGEGGNRGVGGAGHCDGVRRRPQVMQMGGVPGGRRDGGHCAKGWGK